MLHQLLYHSHQHSLALLSLLFLTIHSLHALLVDRLESLNYLSLSFLPCPDVSLENLLEVPQLLCELLIDPILQFNPGPAEGNHLVSNGGDFSLKAVHLLDEFFLTKNEFTLSLIRC